MNKSTLFLLVSIFLITTLPSCFKMPRYRPVELKTVPGRANDAQNIKDVIVKIKAISPKESQRLFGRRGGQITRTRRLKRIIPCHVSIKNKTERILTFGPKDISLPLVPIEMIIKRTQVYSKHRWMPAMIFSIPLTAQAPALIIAANGLTALSMAKWSYYNEDLALDLADKTITEDLSIYPGQQVDKLIFVKEQDLKHKPLTITLFDEDDYTFELTFNLNMHTQKQ